MTDTSITTPQKEKALKLLNLSLRLHPEYEDWMMFDDLEIKGNLKIPRYRSPVNDQTQMAKHEYQAVYSSVAAQVLPQ